MNSVSSRKSLLLTLCMIVILSVLAACGSNENNSNNGKSNSNNKATNNAAADNESSNTSERTLTDPLGHTVTIPAEPTRIIASYLEDYLVALDVQPAAQWSIADDPMDYLQYALEGTPTLPYDLPFEVVTGHNPDLIIIGDESLISDGKYDSYHKIAPTYALGAEINGDWRKTLQEIGKVLGKEAQAEAALADYVAKAEAAKAKVSASGEAPSAAVIWLVGGTFWMVSKDQSSGDVLYNDLGFAVPALVETISQSEGGIWKSVSLEALAELDADHIFLVNSDTASGSPTLDDIVWKSMKAVKNGNIHSFGPETSWLYTGPIANSQMIDNVIESLGLIN